MYRTPARCLLLPNCCTNLLRACPAPPPTNNAPSPLPHLPHLQVGPHICVFKTHVDVFDKWSPEYATQLQQLADKHGEGR